MPRRILVPAATVVLLAFSAACQGTSSKNSASQGALDVSAASAGTGLLHGRVTTTSGDAYEGRLRFGGNEEALWGNQFNGFRPGNPWAEHAPRGELPRERLSVEILGIEISGPGARYPLGRPFMARFGDITRIEPTHRAIMVTLKSGTVFELDRYEADDLADGLRIWDTTRGMIDLAEGQIASIEFFPSPAGSAGPAPLHGTVQTAQGQFSGLLQWDREMGLLTDQLNGNSASGPQSVAFDAIRSIERVGAEAARLSLCTGETVELAGTRSVGPGNRGIYVDDPRYGRVLVSWDAFVRADLSPATSVPGYQEFAAGQALRGTVVLRDGRRLLGRLVYDLDESETTETLDAPMQGVHYAIPFGRVGTIVPGVAGVTLTLHGGEIIQLEAAGDLAPHNGGMLVFAAGAERAEYVPWREVARVEFSQP